MDGNILVTVFLAVSVSEAIIGKEISGTMAFHANVLKDRLKSLNGQSKNFRVVELEVKKDSCKDHGEKGILIPQTSKAKVKNCYEVEEFILQ